MSSARLLQDSTPSRAPRQERLPLSVGIVGAGMIGQLRARALQRVPSVRLVAVADPVSERARQVAAPFADVRVCGDGLELLNDERLDAVILCTPPSSHERLGVACLAAGKHLLCEKPLATTVAGCEALVRAAERASVSLATGFNLRYSRAAKLARQLFDQGAIGELDHIRAFHGHPGGKEFTHEWVCDHATTGGGALMDNGIHVIDLARWFLGEVRDVTGMATHHTWRNPGCEDNGFLLMRSETGHVATIHASWTEWRGYGYCVEIYGTRGFIRFGYPPLFLVHGRREENGRVKTRRHWFPRYQLLERIRGWQWGLVETLERELDDWGLSILSGTPVPTTGHDGLEAIRIAQSAGHGDESEAMDH